MTKGQKAGDGPIAVEVEKDKSYYWCSCGKSSKQPFCDSSHKGTEFSPLVYKAEETKKRSEGLKTVTWYFLIKYLSSFKQINEKYRSK